MRRPTRRETGLGVGVIGLAALAAVGLAAAAQAWLAAFVFWAGLPLGALFATLVHGLAGGRWGMTLRPALAAMVRTMPLLALLAIPVLLGARQIYPWATAGADGWLGLPFFAARTVVYVASWNAIALGVQRRAGPGGALSPGFAWPCLIVLFATASLAAFDWVMTLEPHWTSTIFGLLVTSGWVLSGFAAAVAAAARAVHGEELEGPARILLALVVLWAYLSAIQLIVIWESDLSREIPWYLRRGAGGWGIVALLFGLAEFAVPFSILLWQKLRRSPVAVSAAALAVVTGHLAETWWLTVPDFTRSFGWAEPIAVLAIGGCLLFAADRDADRRRPAGA